MNIQESMSRIIDHEDIFGKAFYRVFLERFPEVQQYFEHVNIMAQAALLTAALILVERFYVTDSVAAEQYLQVLGSRHHERGIPEELYPRWTQAMLQSLAQFHGSDWSSELEVEWKAAIDKAIAQMLKGYQQHAHV